MALGMAAMLAVSCGEKKDAPKEGEVPATEQQGEASAEEPAVTGDVAAVDNYINVMEKFLEAYKGNNQAEMQKLGMDIANMAQEMAQIDQTKLTKEQADRLTEISKKYQDALMPK